MAFLLFFFQLGSDNHPSCVPFETNDTSSYCSIGAVATTSAPIVLQGSIVTEGFYTLWIYSCGEVGATTITFTAVNPGPNQLSSSQIYFPHVNVAFLALWGIICGYWLFNRISFRKVFFFFRTCFFSFSSSRFLISSPSQL